MGRLPKKNREEILTSVLDVFRTLGYEGATLSLLSEATGLRRASLYHQFPKGKEEMANSALEQVERIFHDEVLVFLERKNISIEERLAETLAALADYYENGRKGCLLAALMLTPEASTFASKTSKIFQDWIGAFAKIACEAGVPEGLAHERAEDAVLQIQGALLLSTGINDDTLFERTLSRIPKLLCEAIG